MAQTMARVYPERRACLHTDSLWLSFSILGSSRVPSGLCGRLSATLPSGSWAGLEAKKRAIMVYLCVPFVRLIVLWLTVRPFGELIDNLTALKTEFGI